ncbi:MAG: hypothetical protein MK141_14140 [Pseudoxanthomonas sp.]|jgi:hypothetical protein|uniref:hypothetical protein n=1 Tax=Pseudoxanthomonas sp. TaxID=1871049 RepID=UPI002582E861|nr:hypothetical protein [Pseudoxanthomonas sp.]MCH2092699.1 hypothetical protein [Pseudoxanthomonas sp.]
MKATTPHIPTTTAFNAKCGELLIVHTVELQECVCLVNTPSGPGFGVRVLVSVLHCRVRREEAGYLPVGTLMTVHPDVPVTFLEQVEPLSLRERTDLDVQQRRALELAVLGSTATVPASEPVVSREPLPTTL